MGLRPWVACAALIAVATLGAGVAGSAPALYGVGPTKACLSGRGATFGNPFAPPLGELPASQRVKVISAALSTSATAPPAFVYLVLSTGPADALRILTRITKALTMPSTPSNSVSGTKGNAAWLIEAIAGRPPAALQTLVRDCLRNGSVPADAGHLTPKLLEGCLGVQPGGFVPLNGAVLTRIGFPPIPARIEKSMLVLSVSADGVNPGIIVFLIFGKNPADAMALRSLLRAVIGAPFAREFSGRSGSAAWFAVPTRRATDTRVAGAKRALLRCVA